MPSLLGALRKLRSPGRNRTLDPASREHPSPRHPTYVVGDIHGCADLLDELLIVIKRDRHVERFTIADLVFVGDYIDRGPESRRVLETLRMEEPDPTLNMTCLMGNHEAMALDFMSGGDPLDMTWLRNGGRETLLSFGIDLPTRVSSGEPLSAVSDAARAAIPTELRRWMTNLPMIWSSGDLFVVHAAYDARLPQEAQQSDTLLWGRLPGFLKSERSEGPWVAHGHTITNDLQPFGRRIPTDSGAYAHGALSAAVIVPGKEVRYLQVTDR